MKYTENDLISELQRAHKELGRVPRKKDMQGKFGFPNGDTISNRFGGYTKALIIA